MGPRRADRWLVAGITNAVRVHKDPHDIALAATSGGFTHIVAADADPRTLPAARETLKMGVPGLVLFVSPQKSWPLGKPPSAADAYPPTKVTQAVQDMLAAVDRESADLVLAHKWDPGWSHCDSGMRYLIDTGLTDRTGVSCPDSHPGAATGLNAGGVACATWNVFDQNLATHATTYTDAGILLIGRAPYDHGALTGHWHQQPPPDDDWRTRWLGTQLDEAVQRSAAFATTAAAHGLDPGEAALRFTLTTPELDGHLVGVTTAEHSKAVQRWWNRGPLDPATHDALRQHDWPDRYATSHGASDRAGGQSRYSLDATDRHPENTSRGFS